MKKTVSAVIMLVGIVFAFVSVASGAPSVTGTWKGKIVSVNSTSCRSSAIILKIIQCNTTSNLIRGTLTTSFLKDEYTSYTLPFIGRFRSDGVIFDMTFDGGSYLSIFAIGQYVAGSPDHIQISDMQIEYYYLNEDYDSISVTTLFDTCILSQ